MILPRAFAAVARVSQSLARRYGTTLERRLKSSSGCCFCQSASWLTAVSLINLVLPVSRILQLRQLRLWMRTGRWFKWFMASAKRTAGHNG